ncbi:MAG TPA: sulfotransferase [Pyrinomonadaceae bacterium]|nr:sulfotransferase [Pyrinomonadaceae bacterium]
MTGSIDDFREWVPVRIFRKDAQYFVEWCHLGEQRFDEAYFGDTIRRRMRIPFNRLFRRNTPVASLEEIVSQTETIPPTGFIFHISRCGSTLVSDLLASLPSNIVISEAPPIDALIEMSRDGDTEIQSGAALKWMVAAFGRRRWSAEQRYFIKFDSWNTLDLDTITKAFPTVPIVFLYRNPIEVIVSHLRKRGSHMVPGALAKQLPELSLDVSLSVSVEEHCARVLAEFLKSALRFSSDEQVLPVDYEELPEAVWGSIADHFGVTFTGGEIARMKERSQFDAKVPQQTFAKDSDSKRATATDEARRAAKEFVDPLYEQLKKKRIKGRP